MNPPIPYGQCFVCGKLTNETQSVHGVGCFKCFLKSPPPDKTKNK